MEELIKQMLEKSLAVAEKTGEFVMTQAPDVLQEFYTWHIISIIGYIIVGVLLLLSAYFIPKLWSIGKNNTEYSDPIKMLGMYFSEDGSQVAIFYMSLSVLIGLGTTGYQLLNLMQILVTPKIYLLEYFL